jgi:hypothetical protein
MLEATNERIDNDPFGDVPIPVKTTKATTIEEWLDQQTAQIARQRQDSEHEANMKAEKERQYAIEQCNKMLASWGLPIVVPDDADANPYIRIGDHIFVFHKRKNNFEGYPSRYDHLRHVADHDGELHVSQQEIQTAADLTRWLTGEYQHEPIVKQVDEDDIVPAPPKPTVPEVYRVTEQTSGRNVQKWLNEQAADGYVLDRMTSCGDGENGTYCYIVVRRVDSNILISEAGI